MSVTDLRPPLSDSPPAPRTGLTALAAGKPALILGMILLTFAFGLGLYGRVMGFGLRRDEMMFVPPAVLLQDWALYQDIFYNHVPYSAWYFRAFAAVFGDGGLLFSARLGVVLGWAALLSVTVWITWRLSGSRALALVAALSLLTHQTLLGPAGMAASNNLLQLPPALLGVGLFLIALQRAPDHPPRAVPLFIAGLALSIAAGVKVSAVAFILPVAVCAFLLPRALPFYQRLRHVVLPVLIGGLIGALPLFALLLADPDLFLAHVLRFHTGPHVAYWQAHAAEEPGLALGLGARVRLAYGIWFGGAALVLSVITAIFAWSALTHPPAKPPAATRAKTGVFWVALATLITTTGMSLMPSPGFPQYYIAPLACLPLVAAVIFRGTEMDSRTCSAILGGGALIMGLLAAPQLLSGIRSALPGQTTTVKRVQNGGAALRAALTERGLEDGRIATFLPIYPLEAGLSVYPELATGQFAYRISAYTEPDLARQYRMTGPEGIDTLFASDPPAAFLLGYEPTLERPLRHYAITHGYHPVSLPHLENRYGAGMVFLKPEGAAQ